jgi:redox-sensitive bicupin YhaK (pirin superfamily)
MPNTKITDLSSVTAAEAHELPVNNAGSDGKVTAGQISRIPSAITVNATTAYTLVLTDAGKTVEINNSSAAILTIPSSTGVNFLDGTYVNIVRKGAGAVSLTTAANVTILSKASARILSTQYSLATVYKSSANSWIACGDLSTV